MIKMKSYSKGAFEREKQRFIAMYTFRICKDCNKNTYGSYCAICYDKKKYNNNLAHTTK